MGASSIAKLPGRIWRNLLRTLFLLVLLLSLSVAEVIHLHLHRSRALVNQAVRLDQRLLAQQEDNLNGKPGQGYFIEVGIGTTTQKLNVLVDTGSSNFAVAAAAHTDIKKYFHKTKSSSYSEVGTVIYVPYTQGNWKGTLGTDVVHFTSLPSVSVRANIAGITSSEKFFINGSNWQGILGMGYSAIARPDATIEPFFDSLTEQTKIEDVFSMQLCGTVDKQNQTDVSMGGSLILGGIDKDLYNPPILYTPIYKEWYYEVVLTDILVAKRSLGMDCKEYNFDKTIVDSGTTNLRLPKKVFSQLVQLVRSEVNLVLPNPPPDKFWSGMDILCWAQGHTPFDAFPIITMTLLMNKNTTFNLNISPQQYLRAIGNTYDSSQYQDCFKFAVTQSSTGTVIGAVVMEGFYVIFDRKQKRVGFAQSKCNARDPTKHVSSVDGPFTVDGPTHSCHYQKGVTNIFEQYKMGVGFSVVFLLVATFISFGIIYLFINVLQQYGWCQSDIESCVYIKPQNDQTTLMTVAYVMAGICGLCIIPVFVSLVQWQCQRWRRQKKEIVDVRGLLKE